MPDNQAIDGGSRATTTCPWCGCRALVIEGYHVPGIDRVITRAFCTSCGLVADEPTDIAADEESLERRPPR
jgi:hypothetical protein